MSAKHTHTSFYGQSYICWFSGVLLNIFWVPNYHEFFIEDGEVDDDDGAGHEGWGIGVSVHWQVQTGSLSHIPALHRYIITTCRQNTTFLHHKTRQHVKLEAQPKYFCSIASLKPIERLGVEKTDVVFENMHGGRRIQPSHSIHIQDAHLEEG